MIVTAAVLVIRDDEHRFLPELAGANAVVHVGDELLAERDDRGRMLVVFGMR
jgi:hypothetical protein